MQPCFVMECPATYGCIKYNNARLPCVQVFQALWSCSPTSGARFAGGRWIAETAEKPECWVVAGSPNSHHQHDIPGCVRTTPPVVRKQCRRRSLPPTFWSAKRRTCAAVQTRQQRRCRSASFELFCRDRPGPTPGRQRAGWLGPTPPSQCSRRDKQPGKSAALRLPARCSCRLRHSRPSLWPAFDPASEDHCKLAQDSRTSWRGRHTCSRRSR